MTTVDIFNHLCKLHEEEKPESLAKMMLEDVCHTAWMWLDEDEQRILRAEATEAVIR